MPGMGNACVAPLHPLMPGGYRGSVHGPGRPGRGRNSDLPLHARRSGAYRRSVLGTRLIPGVSRRLLANPYHVVLAPLNHAFHRLRPIVAGLTVPHPFRRLAHVVRREPLEHLRGVEPARRAPGTQGEELRPELPRLPGAAQPPQLPHSQLGVAFGLACVHVRDLDLDYQVGRGGFDEGFGGLHPFGARGAEVPGALAEVERAVGFHPCAGGIAPS